MPVKKGGSHKKTIGTLIILATAISILFAIVFREDEKEVPVIKGKIDKQSEPGNGKPASIGAESKTPTAVSNSINEKPQIPLKTEPIIVPMNTIDYNRIEKDKAIKELMQKRKKRFGLDKGVDIIIRSNESIKVGTITVPMKEILDKIKLKKGDLITEDLMLKPLRKISRYEAKEVSEQLKTVKTRYTKLEKELEHKRDRLKVEDPKTEDLLLKEIKTLQHQKDILERELKEQIMREGKLEAYGIYVVRENDNIWNIHFSFLKDYFQHKGVLLSPLSDEPNDKGISSGMGRILKFSEHMVYIYNIKERKLDVNLDLLYPLSKIVIFNMGEVFSLLDQIDYGHVDQIRYDGDTIWIPAEQ